MTHNECSSDNPIRAELLLDRRKALIVGKPGLLDTIVLMDYRFVLVMAVTALLYYKPSLLVSVLEAERGVLQPQRTYTIASSVGQPFDAVRFARALVCGFLCWLAAGLLPLLVQSIHWPLIHDAPTMHYAAWRILNGAAPYRGVLDMNLPGVYILHMAVLRVFGSSDAGWRLFDFLWLVLTDCLLWRLCFPVGRWWSGAAVLLYSAFHLSSGPPAMGQRDYLEFLFLAGGLLMAVPAMKAEGDRKRRKVGKFSAGGLKSSWWMTLCPPSRTDPSQAEAAVHEGGHFVVTSRDFSAGDGRQETFSKFGWSFLWSGIAFGCAMSIKPVAVILWLCMAGMAAFNSRRIRRAQWSDSVAILAGGLIVPALLTGWMAASGGLKPFLVTLAGVLPLYSTMHDRPFAAYLAEHWPILLPCVLTIPAALLQGRPDTRRTALIFGVIYGAAHYVLQGKGWLYQLYPLVGFSSALLACTAGAAMGTMRRDLVLAVSTLTIYFTAAFGMWDGRLRPAMALTADRMDTVTSLQNDLRPRLAPGVTVQSFDTTGGCVHALFRMNVALPTKYLSDFLLFDVSGRPYIDDLRAQFMSELKRRPPTYLVVYRWGWPSGQYDRIDRFPELRGFIGDNYRIEVSRPRYVLYGVRVIR